MRPRSSAARAFASESAAKSRPRRSSTSRRASSIRRRAAPKDSRRSASAAALTLRFMSSALRASPRCRVVSRCSTACRARSSARACSAAAVAAASRCSSSSRERAASAVVELDPLDLELRHPRRDVLELLADAGEVLLLLEEGEVLRAPVAVEGLEGRLELEEARLEGAVPLGGEGELRLEGAHRLLELLHLAAPLQGAVPLALERPTGHDAVGVEDLAVEGDQRPPATLLLPELEGGGQIADDEGVAEEETDDLLVRGLEADHVEARRDHARVVGRSVRGRRVHPGAAQAGDGDEGGAPLGGGLEVVDRLDALGVALHDDVLEPLAQHRLDGGLVLRRGGDHVGDEAEHAALAGLALAGAGHEAPDAAAVALVVPDDLEQGVEAGALLRELLAQGDELRLVLDELGAGPLEELLLGAALLVEPELELAGLPEGLDVPRPAAVELGGAVGEVVGLGAVLLEAGADVLALALDLGELARVRRDLGLRAGGGGAGAVGVGLERPLLAPRLAQRHLGVGEPPLVGGDEGLQLVALTEEALPLRHERLGLEP